MRSFLEMIQEGGYILYARHGEATIGVDQPNWLVEACSTQRNLSTTGRRQAVAYGEALRNLQIPISFPVIASPFCRTIETALLAFGSANVEVDPLWTEVYQLSDSPSSGEIEQVLNKVTLNLESKPAAGTNQVIIAHSFPEGAGLGRIPNMGTVIINPLGRGKGYEIVGNLSLNQLLLASHNTSHRNRLR
ncbi:histidine phosphatase family protein [Alkalihalophilus pseudofirmus]|uniref:Histidine phosphatase family protein n=1 Tax=Alkalihalophilus pseudofirmus TaxID=79885 RepID=A0AAJ2NS78_ALKPS|nr:histidine phosphatase family protein [Alkalihalophilus pseudofirmus]MDV2887377.1 histidine phosphatase family protein [Alkalihalophilus pseudofirmus]